MEGSLNQWSHDATHVHLVSTAVPLAIVLHPQPAAKGRKKKTTIEDMSEVKGKKTKQRRQIGNVWEEKKNKKQRKEAVAILLSDIG